MKRRRIRDLTWEERATWGECPACGAEDGERCDPNVTLFGSPVGHAPEFGAHLGRMQRAPRRVQEVPIS